MTGIAVASVNTATPSTAIPQLDTIDLYGPSRCSMILNVPNFAINTLIFYNDLIVIGNWRSISDTNSVTTSSHHWF